MHVRILVTLISLWVILQKQNILKGRFHIEEEYCGIHYQPK